MDLLEQTGRAEATHFWFRGFRRFVGPAIARHAAGRRDLRLLDCGCGTAGNVALLAPHGRTFAFDLSAYGSERARDAGVPALRADITRMPFADGSFDIVTSFDVLQCVNGDVEAMAEMARVLKPGGVAIVTVAALELLRGDHAEFWHEVRRYTPRLAQTLVEGAGLRAERVSFVFASLFPLMLVVRAWQRLLRPYRQPRADNDIRVPPLPVNAALTWLVGGEAVLAHRIPMPVGCSLLVVARKIA
jgi:SAM-dependent methyltransferase